MCVNEVWRQNEGEKVGDIGGATDGISECSNANCRMREGAGVVLES